MLQSAHLIRSCPSQSIPAPLYTRHTTPSCPTVVGTNKNFTIQYIYKIISSWAVLNYSSSPSFFLTNFSLVWIRFFPLAPRSHSYLYILVHPVLVVLFPLVLVVFLSAVPGLHFSLAPGPCMEHTPPSVWTQGRTVLEVHTNISQGMVLWTNI